MPIAGCLGIKSGTPHSGWYRLQSLTKRSGKCGRGDSRSNPAKPGICGAVQVDGGGILAHHRGSQELTHRCGDLTGCIVCRMIHELSNIAEARAVRKTSLKRKVIGDPNETRPKCSRADLVTSCEASNYSLVYQTVRKDRAGKQDVWTGAVPGQGSSQGLGLESEESSCRRGAALTRSGFLWALRHLSEYGLTPDKTRYSERCLSRLLSGHNLKRLRGNSATTLGSDVPVEV
jgi:hypothetical protein